MEIKCRCFVLTILVYAISVQPTYACQCPPPITNSIFESVFLHSQKFQGGETDLAVVIAEVKEHRQYRHNIFDSNGSPIGDGYPTEMVLAVSGVIHQGNLVDSAGYMIVEELPGVVGGCGISISSFPIGENFIFALGRGHSGNYFLPTCGVYAEKILSVH